MVNNRVAINKGSDNIGDFQTKLGNQLKRYFQFHQPITVWYNPANPAESIISCEIRWGLLSLK